MLQSEFPPDSCEREERGGKIFEKGAEIICSTTYGTVRYCLGPPPLASLQGLACYCAMVSHAEALLSSR
jgi:hypothetical protein